MAKGLSVTLKHATRRPVTTQYPEERLNVSKRFRGQEHVWDPEACTACTMCARACPQNIIKLTTKEPPEGEEKKKKVIDTLEIDEGRCSFCGFCVEACPTNALFFGRSYERARFRRNELVSTKESMSSPEKKKSAWYHADLEDSLPEQDLLIYRKKGWF